MYDVTISFVNDGSNNKGVPSYELGPFVSIQKITLHGVSKIGDADLFALDVKKHVLKILDKDTEMQSISGVNTEITVRDVAITPEIDTGRGQEPQDTSIHQGQPSNIRGEKYREPQGGGIIVTYEQTTAYQSSELSITFETIILRPFDPKYLNLFAEQLKERDPDTFGKLYRIEAFTSATKGSTLFDVEENNVVLSQRENHMYDASYSTLEYLNLITRMEKGRAMFSDILHKNSIPYGPITFAQLHKRSIVAYSAPTSLDQSQGKNSMYYKNFHYFLEHGIDCNKHSTVIVTTKVVCDEYRLRIMKMNNKLCRNSEYSIELLEREDKCYDMESMRTFLRETDTSKWDYFLYINCGTIGPKWDKGEDGDLHWTDIFTNRLSETTKLTGVTINLSFYPHVQSFAIATDRIGIDIIKNSDAIYDCGVYNDQSMTEEQRWKIIDSYEIGMSRQILDAGYSINSLVGAFGDSLTINKSDFKTIVERSQKISPGKAIYESPERNIWDSNTEKFLLPYGGDIWNKNTLLSVGKGKIPSWSKFVFFKASHQILLPAINDKVQYNNPSIIILEPLTTTSLPTYYEDPARDICEEAKTNFREASKLSVIVTGYDDSGTTMVSQLIKSDPSLYGGFECGLLLDKKLLLNDTSIPFYDWLLWDMKNDMWGLNKESRDLVVKNARCDAEMYSRLHQYSPLFHHSPNKNSRIVDKTPAYFIGLVKIMDRTPGVPVIITVRSAEKMYAMYKKKGHHDGWIKSKLRQNNENLEKAMRKYPERIHLADTTRWDVEPNEVMEDVFRFLGLEWSPEYLTMNAVNAKRIPGSIMTSAHTAL